jgi:hypothetical protein
MININDFGINESSFEIERVLIRLMNNSIVPLYDEYGLTFNDCEVNDRTIGNYIAIGNEKIDPDAFLKRLGLCVNEFDSIFHIDGSLLPICTNLLRLIANGQSFSDVMRLERDQMRALGINEQGIFAIGGFC